MGRRGRAATAGRPGAGVARSAGSRRRSWLRGSGCMWRCRGWASSARATAVAAGRCGTGRGSRPGSDPTWPASMSRVLGEATLAGAAALPAGVGSWERCAAWAGCLGGWARVRGGRGMGRRRWGLAVVVVWVVVGWLTGPPAAAHALVVATNPAAGAVLPRPPAELQVVFSEPVRPLGQGLTLRSAHGRVPLGPVGHPPGHRDVLAAAVLARLGDGTYTA